MEWPFTLGGGYHFMILEGLVNDTSASRPIIGYAIHLGKNHNQFYANFPIDIRIDGKTTPTIDIVMNVDQWFNGKNQIFLNKDYGYIMEDDAKQLEFKENAASVFSIVQR